jgi:putative DNA primase/helicase
MQFTAEAIDKGLDIALANEAAGILAWAVRGCVEWQKAGLNPPAEVTQATAEYQNESDPLAGFIADYCVESEHAAVKGSEFYQAYKRWADEQGLSDKERLTSTRFGRLVSDRFNKTRDGEGIWYEGVALAGM